MDKIESLADIKDEKAFLNAYNALKQDVTELRSSLKTLEAEKAALTTQLEGLSSDKFKIKAIKAEIAKRLEADGIKDADRLMKYVNLEEVDFDEDDNLVGVDESLNTLKADFPELFDTKRRAGTKSIDANANTPAEVKKSTTEAQVDALFG